MMKKPVLIPRQQTEQMIRILFQDWRFQRHLEKVKNDRKKFRFCELGCGTGAIGLSIAKQLKDKNIHYQGSMIDIDDRAVCLSKHNQKKNGLDNNGITSSLSIFQADMIEILEKLKSNQILLQNNQQQNSFTSQPNNFQQLNLLISNPPYISCSEYNSKTFSKQVKKFESPLALVGDSTINKNGLFYVQKIVQFWTSFYPSGHSKPMLIIQYGGECLKYLGQQIQNSVVLDYYGRRRFIMLFPSQK